MGESNSRLLHFGPGVPAPVFRLEVLAFLAVVCHRYPSLRKTCFAESFSSSDSNSPTSIVLLLESYRALGSGLLSHQLNLF